jgi:hypothetical protein
MGLQRLAGTDWIKGFLLTATAGTLKVLRQVFKGSSRRDATLGITVHLVINIAAKLTSVFHIHSFLSD